MRTSFPSTRFFTATLLWLTFAVFTGPVSGAEEETWRFSEDLRRHRASSKPLPDKLGDSVWHFLRTTKNKGPLGQREWIRDGKYVPIRRFEPRIMNSPVRGWVYDPRYSPLVGVVEHVLLEYPGFLACSRKSI